MNVTRDVTEESCMADKDVMNEIRNITSKGNSALIKVDKNGNYAIYEVKKKVTVKVNSGS
jgi:hypothetical protein